MQNICLKSDEVGINYQNASIEINHKIKLLKWLETCRIFWKKVFECHILLVLKFIEKKQVLAVEIT